MLRRKTGRFPVLVSQLINWRLRELALSNFDPRETINQLVGVLAVSSQQENVRNGERNQSYDAR